MTTEQRLQRLEKSATRWRLLAIALLLLITARLFIGADFIPNEAKFDKVTTKQLVVDGGDAWITLKADGAEASIGMLSAEHVGKQLVLHHAVFLDTRREDTTLSMWTVNNVVVSKGDAGVKLTAAQREGFSVGVTPDSARLSLRRAGQPFIRMGAESPSIVVATPDGKATFAQ